MKKIAFVSLLFITLLAAGPIAAQGMPGMKGMDMKGMDMKGMDMSGSDPARAAHTTRGVVKRLDPVAAKVALAHQPVASLNWPSMTMSFGVRDRALLNGLAEGEEVEVDFVREGKEWIIISVKR